MRPSFRPALVFVLGWVAVSVGLAAFATPGFAAPRPTRSVEILFALANGVVMGLAGAWFETVALPRYGRRLSPGAAVAVRTAFYAAGVPLVIMTLSVFGETSRALGVEAPGVYGTRQTWRFFQTGTFAVMLALATAASFAFNLGRQVRLMVGPGTLWALLVGRYRLPVEEERAFLFLDLTGSTALAQRLGPARFNAFKNDFFHDVAGPVLATGGRIYQYVGDEVVVTWRVRGGRLKQSPVEAFVQIDAAVARNAEQYRRRYGEVPVYKAGLHSGVVVTAEVGDVKKDIVHSGDAVNVAARIEGQCHALGARLLVSEAALALAPLPTSVGTESVGAVDLRGRDGLVRLFRITTPDPSATIDT